jgi:hypothetical protein
MALRGAIDVQTVPFFSKNYKEKAVFTEGQKY